MDCIRLPREAGQAARTGKHWLVTLSAAVKNDRLIATMAGDYDPPNIEPGRAARVTPNVSDLKPGMAGVSSAQWAWQMRGQARHVWLPFPQSWAPHGLRVLRIMAAATSHTWYDKTLRLAGALSLSNERHALHGGHSRGRRRILVDRGAVRSPGRLRHVGLDGFAYFIGHGSRGFFPALNGGEVARRRCCFASCSSISRLLARGRGASTTCTAGACVRKQPDGGVTSATVLTRPYGLTLGVRMVPPHSPVMAASLIAALAVRASRPAPHDPGPPVLIPAHGVDGAKRLRLRGEHASSGGKRSNPSDTRDHDEAHLRSLCRLHSADPPTDEA